MKIRNGFVSNSSSSSFIIEKKHLTEFQIFGIKNHLTIGASLGLLNFEDSCYSQEHFKDMPEEKLNDMKLKSLFGHEWCIIEHTDVIRGSTSMDNLNMHEIMKKLGIDTEKVEWGEY